MKLKQLFLQALANGDMGSIDDSGVVITLKELQQHFPDIDTQDIIAFLPEATLEQGQNTLTDKRFLYRIGEQAYRVHPDAIEEYENNPGLSTEDSNSQRSH